MAERTPAPGATVDSGPTLSEFLVAAHAAYGLTVDGKRNDTFKAPQGFTLIARRDKIEDGFAAAAFEDENGHVIVAFKGTEPNLGNAFGRASLLKADAGIVLNNPSTHAFGDAVEFARNVHTLTGKPIYVAGHSLGGDLAENAAKALDMDVAGGMTFGAPGVPGNTRKNGNLINFVNYGDPVGNDATDTPGAFGNKNEAHFGPVVMVGKASDLPAMHAAAQNLKNIPRESVTLIGAGPVGEAVVIATASPSIAALLHDIAQYHDMEKGYAQQLGIRSMEVPEYARNAEHAAPMPDAAADHGKALKGAGVQHADTPVVAPTAPSTWRDTATQCGAPEGITHNMRTVVLNFYCAYASNMEQ